MEILKKCLSGALPVAPPSKQKKHDSDCILQSVRLYKNPLHNNTWFVLCEVLDRDGNAVPSNYRAQIDDDSNDEFWFGFDQEYVLMSSAGWPLGFPEGGYPEPQGPYYCSIGTQNTAGRELIEEHFALCVVSSRADSDAIIDKMTREEYEEPHQQKKTEFIATFKQDLPKYFADRTVANANVLQAVLRNWWRFCLFMKIC